MRLVYWASEWIAEWGNRKGWPRPQRDNYDRRAEDTKVDGPTYAEVYYEFCADHLRPPQCHEFLQLYAEANRDWFDAHPDLAQGMKYRVQRAWPSLIAEHHLFALASEQGGITAAYKDIEADLSSGTDMRLCHNERSLYVASFTATNDGWAKAMRKTRKPTEPCLYFPLNFDGDPKAAKCGPPGATFHLYTPEHIRCLCRAWRYMWENDLRVATWMCYQLEEGLSRIEPGPKPRAPVQ